MLIYRISIGVVAAMTMPTLIGNYKKQETVSKLKKAYTNISQAYLLSQVENGNAKNWETPQTLGVEGYLNKYWAKYFHKINICYTYSECGYKNMHPYKFADGSDSTYTVASSTRRIPFITSDGIIYTLSLASGNDGNLTYNTGIYIDINGPKGPNIYGKDLFTYTITSKNTILPSGYNTRMELLNKECSNEGKGTACAAKIMKDGWQIIDGYPF